MLDMRVRLKDVENMLENQKKDTIIQRQLKIAHIKYVETQNIVLAYKMFYKKDIEIQGTIKDIQLEENKICLYIGCIVYGYTDAYIIAILELTDENINTVSNIICGDQVHVKGIINIKNSAVFIDKANLIG